MRQRTSWNTFVQGSRWLSTPRPISRLETAGGKKIVQFHKRYVHNKNQNDHPQTATYANYVAQKFRKKGKSNLVCSKYLSFSTRITNLVQTVVAWYHIVYASLFFCKNKETTLTIKEKFASVATPCTRYIRDSKQLTSTHVTKHAICEILQLSIPSNYDKPT